MPELPEVETVKNILKPLLVGHTVESVDILYPKKSKDSYLMTKLTSNQVGYTKKIKNCKHIDELYKIPYTFYKQKNT